jgi:(R,R)-butanediol dehydrogenase/meso-butanediol dehydrogenase/diacetyl reductase
MLALRWHGRRDVRLEETGLELPLGPGILEAEVAIAGICGSDVAEFAHGPFAIQERPHALSGQQPPLTLGHEFSARVTAVGDGVAEVAVGDRVAADACWRCERCEACRSGEYNRCRFGGSIGLCSDGAFATRVRFPAYAAIPLPDGVSDRAGALLEPLAVGLHALDRGGARAGETVIVLGFGAIGACTAAVAAALGLEVLVSEPNEGRRARADAAGHRTFEPGGDARADARAMREMTDGGARLVVDATGVPAVLAGAQDLTRRGGSIVLVGIPKEAVPIDAAKMVLYERSLIASLGYVHDLPRVAALIDQGSLDAEALITKTIALEEAPAEFARLADEPGDDIKVMIDMGVGDE